MEAVATKQVSEDISKPTGPVKVSEPKKSTKIPFTYKVKVTDINESSRSFVFNEEIDKIDLQSIKNPSVFQKVMGPIIRKRQVEMLSSRTWKCCQCGANAWKMVFHPISYLHIDPPTVCDYPGPICQKKACEVKHSEAFHRVMFEVTGSRAGVPNI